MESFSAMKKAKDRLVLGLMIVPQREGASLEERKKLKFESKVPNEVVVDEEVVMEGVEHTDFVDMVKAKYPHDGRYFVVDFMTNKATGHRKLVFCAW